MAAKKAAKKPLAKSPAKPVVKKTIATPTKSPAKTAPKTAAKPAVKAVVKKAAPAKAPAKPVAKTTAKAAVKPVAKPAPKATAKPAPKTAVKPAAKIAVKAATKAEAKAEAKAPAKAATKTVTTAPKKAVTKTVTKTPGKTAAVVTKRPFTPPVKQISIADAPTIVVEPITDPKFLAFVVKQKQRLLDLRDQIVDAMNGSAREAIRSAPEGGDASGSGMHQGDAGSDAYDRDFALSVLAKEQDAHYEIEEALLRVKKGTYGICEMSGKRILIARLEAIPFARLTVECQAQWEKEYGNRKFRPSGSVGFSGGGIFDEDEDSDTISLDDDED